ncbi:IS91 family transposase [Thiococcus pfennigii]|uniref:IS91 family transposase n=1 Tax=Thiococcus pfennigii TaxID=1057 RepID=UPI001906BC40|nr:IS91 family transposase [Thiococcus pfennigii]MBK1701051.1 IS91 family transposase [Thiococcus pfennigii]
MAKPSLQAVVHACLADLAAAQPISPRQWQVCHHIGACRTEALGGLLLECDGCGEPALLYYACRDRHCPRCQRLASLAWCARQRAAVLPVTYHHVVFTLPDVLNGWVEVHPKELYELLFETVWATLSTFGADPRRLDGQLGMTAVLHTWGETLVRHVHLHCLVPGGARGADGSWHPAKSTYLFPVRALARHFRGGFVSRLRHAAQAGRLERLDPAEIDQMLDALMARDWVVYSKPCLTHTETVVDYLGRYSHRIALSDARLVDFDGESVTLRYKDYRDGARGKVMRLSGEELLRRFLLHVLPKGFMRVRHYGFLANRCRARRLPEIRAALAAPPAATAQAEEAGERAPFDGYPCPTCRTGRLRVIARLSPPRRDRGGGAPLRA